jgi:uncharacterized membrane protein HdeD (DUF308 family)
MAASLAGLRWALGLRGVVAILFGVLAFTWPGLTLLLLLVFFGGYALVDGFVTVVGSLVSPDEVRKGWLVPLLGVLSIVVGVLTFARPGMTALILLLLIAARAIFAGCLEIAAAVHYRKFIRGEWLLILGGCLSVLFGLLVFAYPFDGALTVIWLIALYAVLVGGAQVLFALSAKDLVQRFKQSMTPSPLAT